VFLVILAVLIIGAVVYFTQEIPQICSGRGRKYPDATICACWDRCFFGDNCEIINSTNCSSGEGAGQPHLFEQYWIDKKRSIPPIMIDLDYRVSYQFGYYLFKEDFKSQILPSFVTEMNRSSWSSGTALGESIRKLHKKYRNAETDGYNIIFGVGARQLTQAAIYAYNQLYKKNNTFVQIPFYTPYKDLANLLKNTNFNTSLNQDNPIEIVTIPNNPDGIQRVPYYKNTTIIHDLVYYWPHLNAAPINKMSGDVMIFSFTKLSGHAATRFGWALVKSDIITELMIIYMATVTIEPSIESRLKAQSIFNYLNENGDDFFAFGKAGMENAWSELQPLFNNQNDFIIESIPNSAYIWIKCVGRNNTECVNLFKKYNVAVFNGGEFGAPYTDPNGYVRITMTIHPSVIPLIKDGLTKLFKTEVTNKKISR